MLRRARDSRDTFIESMSLAVLGQYALDAGHVEEAMPFLVEAHRVQRDQYEASIATGAPSSSVASPGPSRSMAERAAAQLLSCFETLLEETGMYLERWVARMNDTTLTVIRGQLDADALAHAWQRGRTLTYDEAIALALEPEPDT